MATKRNPESNTETKAGDDFADTVKESAQHIWLAGLGAFSKAQEQGGKVFESLVKEGLEMQRKTQSAAEEKFAEATSRVAGMAGEFTSKASGQWDKLGSIFEDRVSQALNRLGVPTSKEIAMLMARIDELDRKVARLSPQRTTNRTSERPSARTAARTSAKRASKKSA
jgi:poly(hydroxyalkanoate) granule-associated protein